LAILALQSIERSGPLVLDSAAVRLCSTLKSLARPESGDAAGLPLHVDGLTQEELAKMVGVSRNWIAIALGELERLGLITKRRGHITIISARRLDAFIVGARNH
jgi:CRP-like cAMP-binding protein